MNKRNLLTLAVTSALALPVHAASDKDIEALRADMARLQAQNAELSARLNALADAEGGSSMGRGHGGGRSSFGGYGELHYNNLSNNGPAGDQKEIDFHRFVLYLGHEFNEDIRFFSELEVEHSVAGDGENGEVALEQAFLEFDLGEQTAARAGVVLVPVGFINETHEPNTFYGVERPVVESAIIPTTWGEAGGMLSSRFDNGFSVDAAVTSGMNTNAGKNYAVRSGRQSVSEAVANDLAYTLRVRWTGLAGVELGAALNYQSDMTQSLDATAGSGVLAEAHASVQKGDFGLRALYATWNLDGSGPASVGADEQTGWYVEPSYKVTPKVGVFARYSVWDNQAGDNTDSEYAQTNIGVNYWPHPDVVLKADYQTQSSPTANEYKGFNLGVGYQF